MKKKRVIYLLSIENVAVSPLIRSQVIELLFEISKKEKQYQIIVVSLLPFINFIRYRHSINDVRTELGEHGIKLSIIPILYLTRYFHIPHRLVPFYRFQAWLAGHWIGRRWKPSLVHCRSYPASIVGQYIKHNVQCKLVFDVRSLYPEEGAVVSEGAKGVMFDDESYKSWKRSEKSLVEDSDATIAISESMRDILAAQYPSARDRLAVIPNVSFVPNEEELSVWRETARKEMTIREGDGVLCYVGSWFEPDATLGVFNKIIQAKPDTIWHILLLVSSRNTQDISRLQADVVGTLGKTANRAVGCIVKSVPHNKVFYYLAGADLAVLPMAEPGLLDDVRYQMRSRSIYSIKFTEYLSCGLSVFASRNWAGAAAEMIEQHELGFLYDDATDASVRAWLDDWSANRLGYRQKARNIAQLYFSRQTVVEKHIALYEDLL